MLKIALTMIHTIEEDFRNDIILSAKADIAPMRNKSDLLRVVRINLRKIFYFNHSSTVLFSPDKKTYRSVLIDPDSKLRHHADYDGYLRGPFDVHDGIMDVIIATGKPVVIDVISELESAGKSILKVPYMVSKK